MICSQAGEVVSDEKWLELPDDELEANHSSEMLPDVKQNIR